MLARFTFSVDAQSQDPLYQQLRQQLLNAMADGRLRAGDQLPSSRGLADTLGVSRSVITHTYDQLIAEGALLSFPKRGVYVAGVERLHADKVSAPVHSDVKRWHHFDSGADVSAFANKAWAASMRRAWLQPSSQLLSGEFDAGFPPLQQAICDYLQGVRGLTCVAQQIILVAGNRDALTLLQHVLAKHVSQWLIEDPTYPPIRATLAQRPLTSLPMSSDGTQVPDDQRDWAAVLTPNRQYPLGVSYSSRAREAWLAATVSHNGFIIEDDYDNEFLYQGHGQVPLCQTAQLRGQAVERVFYVGSFSKVLFRGLRLGFIVAPLSYAQALRNSQKALGSAASLPIQPAVADFMENGEFYRHLNRMRRLYRQKRDHLLLLLAQHLSPWFTWEKPKGGMHVVAYVTPTFQRHQWCDQVHQYCLDQGLSLSWLQHHYTVKDTAPMGLVLGFSAPSLSQLAQWVDLLRAACEQANDISDDEKCD